jgi:starch-binding outer membrane protein, SusD/RagB family
MKLAFKIAKISRHLVIIILLSFVFSSCSKGFLDVVPIDRVAKDNFFKTESDLRIAVNGVYAAQRSLYADGSWFVLEDARSDNTTQNVNDQAERVAPESFTDDAGNLLVLTIYTQLYDIVNLCNAIIERAPNATGDEAAIARIVAEAKFLRAATYFELVQDWGEVPLKTTESLDFGNVILPRSSVADIYNFIVSELTEAASVLPKTYDGTAGNEIGRATWGAATGLLGKVQLQQGKKAEAAAALQSVVDANLYSLLPSYVTLWDPASQNTAESLYEIQFEPANQTGSPYTSAFIPPTEANALGIVAGGNAFAVRPTADLVNAYESGDLRKDASLAIDGAGLPYIIKYLDLQAAASGARNNFPVLRYADVLLALAEALGESPEAYGYINLVRERAGLDPIDGSTPGTFINKVQHERRVELAFEGHRWHDLLRLPSDKTISIMSAQLTAQFGRSIQLSSRNLLYPIPIAEIQTSDGIITQNPGY